MSKEVIMPALGMAQETGTLIRWLKAPGEPVTKGEPLMEVETDKATVEIEAPASGILAQVTAAPGDTVPVGQRIALLLAPGDPAPAASPAEPSPAPAPVSATPIAARMAAEHNLDLAQIKPEGGRVQKEDVLAYLNALTPSPAPAGPPLPLSQRSALGEREGTGEGVRLRASPKARRLAKARGLALKDLQGTGPEGAVLAADVLAVAGVASQPVETSRRDVSTNEPAAVSRLWRIMVDRVSQAWTTIPHFYLLREVNASALTAWRAGAQGRAAAQDSALKITYTDLLVKLVAFALRRHPRLNASWHAERGTLVLNPRVNVGLAVAVDDGLIVPVIHDADTLGLGRLAERRAALVAKAQAGKLSPDDLGGGTFTLSNLGMYGVDAFNAIVNPPQAAILAVSRIADRVVPLNGQPAVQPMLTLSLSCDHRAVDGARGAEFLQTLAGLIENPMQLLD